MQPDGVNQKYNLKNKINHCRQKSKYFNCLAKVTELLGYLSSN